MTTEMIANSREDVWREVHREQVSLVYFLQRTGHDIRRTDGDIKIGYASDFMSRIIALKGQQGSLTLLAAEPGGRTRERELHRQFDACRITRQGEWFRPVRILLDYIASVAEGFAYPVHYPAPHPSEVFTGLASLDPPRVADTALP